MRSRDRNVSWGTGGKRTGSLKKMPFFKDGADGEDGHNAAENNDNSKDEQVN